VPISSSKLEPMMEAVSDGFGGGVGPEGAPAESWAARRVGRLRLEPRIVDPHRTSRRARGSRAPVGRCVRACSGGGWVAWFGASNVVARVAYLVAACAPPCARRAPEHDESEHRSRHNGGDC
jgi:hypothetical protein